MNQFKKDWEKYTLNIEGIELNWNNVEDLAFYSTLQSGLFGKRNSPFSKQIFFEEFPIFYEKMWKLNKLLGVEYKENAKVLDIGSGVAIMDLLLAKSRPDVEISLLDKEDLTLKKDIFYTDEYFFYNSWSPILDCIKESNIENTINFLRPEDDWSEQFDYITSYFSWCMHYPKETYWQKVLNHLKPKGTLIVDVRNLKDRNVVEEISEELKSTPKTFTFKNSTPDWIDNYGDETLGYRCVWINQK